MSRLTLRIDFKNSQLGPGKVRLLEMVDELESITAAGKAMDMSYRRAWLLVDELNTMFKSPLVETRRGGRGGNASLTVLGRAIVQLYRGIERESVDAATRKLAELERHVRATPDRDPMSNVAPPARKR